MSLPFRPVPLLLLAALLGAGSVAMASPQQQHQNRRGDRMPMARDGQAGQDEGASRRPQRQDMERPDMTGRPQRRNDDNLSDSVRRVEQRTRGQVLSAEPVPYDGRNLNRIKVVDERGRVRVYMDDPQQQRGQDSTPTRDNDD